MDVVKDHRLGGGPGVGNEVVEAVGFEGGPKGFGGGVIVTVSATTHALGDGQIGQGGGEVMAGVLAALIAVVDEAGQTTWTLGDGFVEGFEHEAGFQVVVGRPAQNAPAEKVDFSGEKEPAFSGGNAGDIRDQDLVGFDRRWRLQEALRGDCPVVRGMKRPFWRARRPSWRIKRAMRLRPQQCPRARSS